MYPPNQPINGSGSTGRLVPGLAMEIYAIIDANDYILDWSRLAEQMFGWRREEVLGQSLGLMFVPPWSHSAGIGQPSAVGSQHLLDWRMEMTARRKDGVEFPVELTVTRLDAEDSAARFSLSFRDPAGHQGGEAILLDQTDVLRSVLDGMADAVVVAGLDAHLLLANQAAEKMFGIGSDRRSLDEVIQGYEMYRADGVTPYPLNDRPIMRALHGENVDNALAFIRHPEIGRCLWVSANARPLNGPDGSATGAVAVFRDMTAARQAEEGLRASEERFRATFEHAPVGIAHVGLDGKWLRVNHAIYAFLGYTPDELSHLRLEDVTHPDDVAADVENARRLLAGEVGGYQMDKRYLRKDGAVVWGNLSVTLVRRPDGAPEYIIGIVEDITARKAAEMALAESRGTLADSEQRYKSLFDYNPSGVFSFDLQGHFLSANAALERLTGYTLEDIRRMSFMPIVAPEDQARTLAHFRQAAAGAPQNYEVSGVRKDGSRFEVNVTNLPMVVDGRITGIYGIAVDITERRRAEEALRQAEENYRLLVEGATDYAILMLDPDGRITSWSAGAENIFGYAEDEVLGKASEFAFTPEDRTRGEPMRELERAKAEGRAEDRRWHLRRDQSRFFASGSVMPLWNTERTLRGFVKVMRDDTARWQAEERALYLANRDMLTGLANRANFSERLHDELARARRDGTSVALLMLDLDRFKSVNDTLGHHVGDLLLKEVAARLNATVRETDIAARLGGDEFVVIQARLESREQAGALAGKLVAALGGPYILEGEEIHSGTSIGVALYPDDAGDPVELLKNADMALYRAKALGRHNYQFYTQALQAEAASRASLESRLHRALERREFRLFYQPVIDLGSWHISGAEALLRWADPELALMSPSAFLSVAEETGLIEPMGEWGLREACRQNRAWREEGIPPFRISVNVSNRQLKDPKFAGKVSDILSETGLSADCLDLEVHSDFFAAEEASSLLGQLREVGVRIVVDDFGAGYSALSHFQRFPVDALKIDRGLVNNIARSRADNAIVSAAISLARELGIRVVGEGVETQAQLAFLQERECTSAQGFLLGPPMPAEAMGERLHHGNWTPLNPA